MEGIMVDNISSSPTLFYNNTPYLFYNNTTIESNDTEIMTNGQYKDFYDTTQFVTGLIIYPTVCLYGLVGSVLILAVIGHQRPATSTNIYFFALAIADIIKLLNDALYFLTVLLMHTNPTAGNRCYGYLYPYAHFIFNMSVCISSWLIVIIAVERYILVCHPTRARSIVTIHRSKLITITCCVIMTSAAIPSALRYETVTEITIQDGVNVTEFVVITTKLWHNETFVDAYVWMQSLLRSIIPLFILITMNAFIINAVRKTRANKKMASRNKITVMLIIVISFFVICIIPDSVMSSVFKAGYAESSNYLIRGVREITDTLLAINASTNFTLYMIFNKLFRDQFLKMFCKSCQFKRKRGDEYQKIIGLKDKPNVEKEPVVKVTPVTTSF